MGHEIEKPKPVTIQYYDYCNLRDWSIANNLCSADDWEKLIWNYGITNDSIRTMWIEKGFNEEFCNLMEALTGKREGEITIDFSW